MPPDLFDRQLRALRRDRAARSGPALFLYDRAFDECLDRLGDISRSFDRAMVLGCPSPDWPARLAPFAGAVEVFDPGALFAANAGGAQIEEDRHDFGAGRFDLCIAIGTLDTVNDLPLALARICRALTSDAPLIGAMAGANSLPALRSVLIEAGRGEGRAVARTHPRIDPPTMAQLLAASGFGMPVVDIDRIRLRYDDLDGLIRDLRAMGTTSVLTSRTPPVSRAELDLARKSFVSLGAQGRTEEIVEIVHFLAWTK